MKNFRVLALALILAMGVTSAAQAVETMIRKVDSFDFLVDYSGSMMMKHTALKQNKMDLAKFVMTRVNRSIPDLGYKGALHTFAPAGTVMPLAPWAAEPMDKAIASLSNDLPVFGRLTPMGTGIASLAPEYAPFPRPTALIMVSDGASNYGSDPVAEAQLLYRSQPGICFHVISLADTPEGQETLQRIAALDKCSVMVDAKSLMQSQAAVDKFVEDVFYTKAMEEAMILRGVNFAFDSYALDKNAQGILDEVAAILKGRPGIQTSLEGWTDYIGTDEYNAKLSQRRADAVRDYLVKKGVPANSITAKGMGKSYKYDNATDQGRYLNRRTELLFK